MSFGQLVTAPLFRLGLETGIEAAIGAGSLWESLQISRPAELRRLQNVVLQQMEHDDMVSDNRSDPRVAPAPQRKDIHSAPAASRSGPPILSEGLEFLRRSHC